MTATRSNILENATARDKFIEGVQRLKQEVAAPGQASTYDSFVIWHHQSMMTLTPPSQLLRNAAHVGPVFLPWHRFMLIVLERQIQRVLNDPDFGLPYWSWNLDGDQPPEQQRRSRIWDTACMGSDGDPVSTGPFAYAAGDPASWRVAVQGTPFGGLEVADRGLRRRFGSDGAALPTTAHVKAALALPTYDEPPWTNTSSGTFRNVIEGWRPNPPRLHNRVHVWVGGDMGVSTSPNDPVFYLNHANVDRIWAAWQVRHGAAYLPDAAAPVSLRGHRLSDRLHSAFPDPPTPAGMLDVSDVYRYDRLDDIL